MKRRNLILSFVIVALLLVGIGYASLSQKLTIGGEGAIKASSATFDVQFVSVKKAVNGGEATDVTDANVDVHTIQLNHDSLVKKDDKVVFTITVENKSDQYKAKLDAALTDLAISNTDYFKVETDYATAAGTKVLDICGAADEADQITFTITVTLKKAWNGEGNAPVGKVSATFNGTAVEVA